MSPRASPASLVAVGDTGSPYPCYGGPGGDGGCDGALSGIRSRIAVEGRVGVERRRRLAQLVAICDVYIVFGGLERIVAPRVNEIRKRVGVPPLSRAADLFMAPPLLLYLTAEPFEYPAPTGLTTCVSSAPATGTRRPSPRLGEVEAPIVLVTTSSEFQDDGRLVRCALDALAGEQLYVVATLPSGDPMSLDAPANSRVLSFLPHARSSIAPPAQSRTVAWAPPRKPSRAASRCASRHSDVTSSKLPVASRSQARAPGFPPKRMSPKRLRAAVKEAIRRHDGARRIAEAYREAGGAVAAADALEERIGSPSAAPVRP